jgi:hypothetical protein
MKEWTNRNLIISPTPTDCRSCAGTHLLAYLTIKYPLIKFQTDFYQTILQSHRYWCTWQFCMIGDGVKGIGYTTQCNFVAWGSMLTPDIEKWRCPLWRLLCGVRLSVTLVCGVTPFRLAVRERQLLQYVSSLLTGCCLSTLIVLQF